LRKYFFPYPWDARSTAGKTILIEIPLIKAMRQIPLKPFVIFKVSIYDRYIKLIFGIMCVFRHLTFKGLLEISCRQGLTFQVFQQTVQRSICSIVLYFTREQK